MEAINPAAILSQLADNEPAATHTYIINGTQQIDTYTAGEIRKYLYSPKGYIGPLFTTADAADFLNQYIF